jgi:hypothetical protein
MRSSRKHPRRTQLTVESLEGKALPSTGSLLHQIAQEVSAAPIVSQATVGFSGTLAGRYGDTRVPFVGSIQTYAASGTLNGPGSTHLYGTLIIRPGAALGRFDGQLVMVNHGGSMVLNVYQSATAGTFSYKVVVGVGSDSAFKGGIGTLTVTQTPTFRVPYYVHGQSTMTFTSG